MIRRWWWILLVTGLLGPFLGLFGAAVITYVMPKKYESVAVVQVVPGSVQMAPDGGAEPMHSMPSRFMATEMEVITARKTLEMAAKRLDLPMRWGVDPETAVNMTRETVSVENIRGTDLLRIGVRHTNAEDARDVAMGVAKAYRERKAEFEQKQASQADPIQARLARNPVVIHEEPTLARAPVSPNVKLNLVMGFVAGLPGGLVIGLLLMLLLGRTSGRKK